MLGKKDSEQKAEKVKSADVVTPQDQEWVTKHLQKILDRKSKKISNKTAKKMITKADRIKGIGAGMVAGAGAWVAYNFAFRKMVAMDLDKKLQNDQEVIKLVFDEIAKQYPTYISEGTVVNENVIADLAQQLSTDGKQEEAQLILELLNGVNSGVYHIGDINTFLVNNNLSTTATNMVPSQAELDEAFMNAYTEVHGIDLQGLSDTEILQKIIDEKIRPLGEPGDSIVDLFWVFDDLPIEQQQQLDKIVEDYFILLNKTTNAHSTAAQNITEQDVDAYIASVQEYWSTPFTGGPDASMLEKLQYIVKQGELEMAGFLGESDMQVLMAIQSIYEQTGSYAGLTEYMDYRTLYDQLSQQTDKMNAQDVLELFGYEGDILAEYTNMGTDDYIFARIMEDKYQGLDCVKDNGQINLNDISGLSADQVADYKADLAKYTEWKEGASTQDTLEAVQNMGYLSDGYQEQIVNETFNQTVNSPLMSMAKVAITVGAAVGVIAGYRHFKKNRYAKRIQIWNEEMAKRGLTEEDFVKHHYSFEEVDDSNNQAQQKVTESENTLGR